MYEANSPKELKKLMKEDKFPILVKDEKTIRVVGQLERRKNRKKYGKMMGLVSEPTLIILAIISAVMFISLYALYKDKNIEIEVNQDGSIKLKASN